MILASIQRPKLRLVYLGFDLVALSSVMAFAFSPDAEIKARRFTLRLSPVRIVVGAELLNPPPATMCNRFPAHVKSLPGSKHWSTGTRATNVNPIYKG